MTIKYYPPETKWNLEDYYQSACDWYHKNYKAELIGWLYTSNSNYYTLPLKDKEGDVTPLMLFHRGETPDSCFSFENEREFKCTKLLNDDYKCVEINKDKFLERSKKYPWIIMTEKLKKF